MEVEGALTIEYADHASVRELIDVVTYCTESVSLDFDAWDDPRVRGPGLYFLIVAGTTIADYADPMGTNRWPTDDCEVVEPDTDRFFETARSVAIECDGAVVISVDGAIQEQMVRVKDLAAEELASLDVRREVEYAPWMGARHMSAVDTSLRDEVITSITLSEDDGRVTVFADGEYEDVLHDEIGGEWRGRD